MAAGETPDYVDAVEKKLAANESIDYQDNDENQISKIKDWVESSSNDLQQKYKKSSALDEAITDVFKQKKSEPQANIKKLNQQELHFRIKVGGFKSSDLKNLNSITDLEAKAGYGKEGGDENVKILQKFARKFNIDIGDFGDGFGVDGKNGEQTSAGINTLYNLVTGKNIEAYEKGKPVKITKKMIKEIQAGLKKLIEEPQGVQGPSGQSGPPGRPGPEKIPEITKKLEVSAESYVVEKIEGSDHGEAIKIKGQETPIFILQKGTLEDPKSDIKFRARNAERTFGETETVSVESFKKAYKSLVDNGTNEGGLDLPEEDFKEIRFLGKDKFEALISDVESEGYRNMKERVGGWDVGDVVNWKKSQGYKEFMDDPNIANLHEYLLYKARERDLASQSTISTGQDYDDKTLTEKIAYLKQKSDKKNVSKPAVNSAQIPDLPQDQMGGGVVGEMLVESEKILKSESRQVQIATILMKRTAESRQDSLVDKIKKIKDINITYSETVFAREKLKEAYKASIERSIDHEFGKDLSVLRQNFSENQAKDYFGKLSGVIKKYSEVSGIFEETENPIIKTKLESLETSIIKKVEALKKQKASKEMLNFVNNTISYDQELPGIKKATDSIRAKIERSGIDDEVKRAA